MTAPGATLALGLMYLRSGNEAVAGRLGVSRTHNELDFVRGELIFLRVVASHIV